MSQSSGIRKSSRLRHDGFGQDLERVSYRGRLRFGNGRHLNGCDCKLEAFSFNEQL